MDDYGYETLITLTKNREIGKWFTQTLIAYWVIVSAVLLLNIFIAVMSGSLILCLVDYYHESLLSLFNLTISGI